MFRMNISINYAADHGAQVINMSFGTLHVILHHQERLDGTGDPGKLRGGDIPFESVCGIGFASFGAYRVNSCHVSLAKL
jgi:hypothetical protein